MPRKWSSPHDARPRAIRSDSFDDANEIIQGWRSPSEPHHERNIWKMGRLKDRIPLTYRTFLVGTLALCGVPPLCGFYSKDAILAAAHEHSMTLFAVGILVDRFSYTPAFLAAGLMPLFATACVWLLIRPPVAAHS